MTIDEFLKVELKVGTITAAERVEGSEKLLKLQVDLGATADGQPDARQVLSGIGKQYAPEDVLGRQAVFVANLDPRTMMGMESRGMLLAASAGEDGIALLAPDRAVPPGSEVR